MRVTQGIYGFFLGFLCALPVALAISVGISWFGNPGGSLLGVESTAEGLKLTNILAVHGTALLLPLVVGVLGFIRGYGENGRAQQQESAGEAPVGRAMQDDSDPGTALERRLRRSTWRVPSALLRRETRRSGMRI